MLMNNPKPAPNSLYPMSAPRVARSRARVAAMNDAAARAKFAVLGYCRVPGPGDSPALAADIAATPNYMELVTQAPASGSTSTGAGNYDPGETVESPNVVPMGQGAVSLPAYPCQTSPCVQNPVNPTLPAGLQTPPATTPENRNRCPLQVTPSINPLVQPSWGSAPGMQSNKGWWLVAGLIAFGAVLQRGGK